LREASAPDGSTLRLIIGGAAGGEWVALRHTGEWLLGTAPELPVDATIELDEDVAWRVFTKGMSRDDARQAARMDGDQALAVRALDTVSILA